jgi:hypothetical protein
MQHAADTAANAKGAAKPIVVKRQRRVARHYEDLYADKDAIARKA